MRHNCKRNAGTSVVLAHVALGGAVGGLARYAVGAWVVGWSGTGFPIATLGVNVSGALLLGVLSGVLPRTGVSPAQQAMLTVGFCGGFTTFSAFSWELFELLQRQDFAAAFAYVALTALLGPLAYLTGQSASTRRQGA